jgi:hypothetical protein
MRMWILLATVGMVAALLAGSLGATRTAPRPPTVQVMRATLDRTAHTIDLRLRICFSAGPRARIAITERRSYRGTVATHRWIPSGEIPTRISPFACRTDWRLNWLLETPLRGPGAYSATIRVRDAYDRWTPPVALTLISP